MHRNSIKNITHFYLAGISYRKTDAETRGRFAVGTEQYAEILAQAASYGADELFIISTCNRTEIYGFADRAQQLVNLLCSRTAGDAELFAQHAYIKQGAEAIRHLLDVSCGLDSQILGDYEIVGQIKTAVKFSKERGFIAAFTERLVNAALQCSKAIKNQTALSGGTVSVSFAAAQYIRDHVRQVSQKKIVLLGTGKIGRNTCKNLVDYLDTRHITLINRTEERAAELAAELGLQSAPLECLEEQVAGADIILVATNAGEPIILRSHLEGHGPKLIIDLSIPCNVEDQAQQLPGITLVNVDQLSRLKDETLARRQAEVPKARTLIASHIEEFMDWYEMRKNVPVLKAIKTKLEEIQASSLATQLYPAVESGNPGYRIQKVINGLAPRMRERNQAGCHYIQAINEFIATGTD
ncbi:MAG TPA: glutamyl-tRNA reductase [Chitinophagaceae bacterium]|nr:glutamyl-tRNA reductase [Chitinophagaceae bacterium]